MSVAEYQGMRCPKCRAPLITDQVAAWCSAPGCDYYQAVKELARIRSCAHEIVQEYRVAALNHPPFNSPHEGWAVLVEEVDELWQHVKNRYRSPEVMAAMRTEAVQVGAMALRFVLDMDREPGR